MGDQKPDFYIRRVAVFDKALTDRQLHQLSKPYKAPWWKTLFRAVWPWRN